MYCADSLSRRRTSEEDDKEPFFVESGQLFKLHTPAQCGEESTSLLQYLQVQTNQALPVRSDGHGLPSTCDTCRDLWDPTQWIRQAPTPGGAQDRIIKSDKGGYTLKVLHDQDEDDTRSVEGTETVEDPIQLIGDSVGYSTGKVTVGSIGFRMTEIVCS